MSSQLTVSKMAALRHMAKHNMRLAITKTETERISIVISDYIRWEMGCHLIEF